MADEITTQIAMTDPTLTSALGLPENQFGTNILPLIAPDVQVNSRAFKARQFGKDRFKKHVKVSRPRGGDAERISTTYKNAKSFSVDEKTLKDVLDRRDIEEAANAPDGGFNLRLMQALTVRDNLNTTIEAAAATMFLDENNYGSNKTAVGTTFSGSATLSTIRTAQNAIIKTWAVRPATLVLTPEAWAEVQDNSTITDRIKYTSGETLTEEAVARYLQVDKVIVPYTVWFDEADAGAFVWAGKKGLLLYANPNAGLNGPTFAKTFYRNVNGLREEVRSGFDMPGNEHIYVAREEETAIVFADAAWIWY